MTFFIPSAEEFMLLNCGFGEGSWKSLGLQGDPTVPSKGDQSWVFIGGTDVEAEIPVLWPPDSKRWLIWKDPDARKEWRWEEKGTTENEMVGWHYRLEGLEFEQLRLLVMDREAWRAAVPEITKSQKRLSDWTEQKELEGDRTYPDARDGFPPTKLWFWPLSLRFTAITFHPYTFSCKKWAELKRMK